MPLSPDLLRALLAICIWSMAVLAAVYLQRRSLPVHQYICWGLLIILVPLLGPFLVVLYKPGKRRE